MEKDFQKDKKLNPSTVYIQLANAMFVSPSTISGYRTGRRSPTVADLAAIVQILNVSADYLIGTSEITTRPDTTEKKS